MRPVPGLARRGPLSGRAMRWPVDHELRELKDLEIFKMKRSKAYRKVDELVNADTLYSPREAVDLARKK